MLTIGQGRYAGQPFRLLGWQRRLLSEAPSRSAAAMAWRRHPRARLACASTRRTFSASACTSPSRSALTRLAIFGRRDMFTPLGSYPNRTRFTDHPVQRKHRQRTPRRSWWTSQCLRPNRCLCATPLSADTPTVPVAGVASASRIPSYNPRQPSKRRFVSGRAVRRWKLWRSR